MAFCYFSRWRHRLRSFECTESAELNGHCGSHGYIQGGRDSALSALSGQNTRTHSRLMHTEPTDAVGDDCNKVHHSRTDGDKRKEHCHVNACARSGWHSRDSEDPARGALPPFEPIEPRPASSGCGGSCASRAGRSSGAGYSTTTPCIGASRALLPGLE